MGSVPYDAGSRCLDESRLAALVSGALGTDELREVDAHLAECIDCCELVAAAAHAVGGESSTAPSALDAELTEAAPGSVIAGKYRVEGLLGRGGMGMVLAAQHIELGHRVAIKVLKLQDRTAEARFLREARTCARLFNDHIARVFDIDRLPSGVPYFVMEHLVGEDLGRLMARGPVPVSVAIDYVLQACAALEEAHAAGVVHRDLKPSNLFIVRRADGKPWLKVLDFGISKLVTDGGSELSSLTLPQAIVGSPLYMSPEQIRASNTLDARSDIWSMGVILYELLTGQRPFAGATLSALSVSIATAQPLAPSTLVPNLPAGIEAVVLRCLQKEATARFSSMGALVESLAQVKVRAPSTPSRWRAPWIRWQMVALAGVGLLSLGGSSWLWLGNASRRSATSEPEVSVRNLGVDTPQHVERLPIVNCERPLPVGDFRLSAAAAPSQGGVWQRTLPIEWLCEAEVSAERARDLLDLLRNAPTPSLALDTRHPFAVLDWVPDPEQPRIKLTYAPVARVAVALTGSLCDKVGSVELMTADESSLPAAGALAAGISPGTPCTREVELPRETFGRRLRFRLHPVEYAAKDAVFTSSPIELEVRRLRRKPAARCVPPQFCRD